MLVAVLLAAAAASAPAPRTPKVFGDWIVACNNRHDCGATALIPEGAQDGWLVMELNRKAEGPADPEIEILDVPKAAAVIVEHGRSAWLRADANGLAALPAIQNASMIDALRTTPAIELMDREHKMVARVSAKGASAALLYMDEQQGRLGTTSALARPGMGSPYTLPKPPALPVITAARPSSRPPLHLPAAELKSLQGDRDCDRPPPAPSYARLDAGHSLALVTDICASGAYNMDTAIEIISDAHPGDPQPADLEQVAGPRREGDNIDDNAEWDAKAQVLRTSFLGRGLGDCRTEREYVWDGRRFRLSAQAEMDECRGGMDTISTWRTEVRRP